MAIDISTPKLDTAPFEEDSRVTPSGTLGDSLPTDLQTEQAAYDHGHATIGEEVEDDPTGVVTATTPEGMAVRGTIVVERVTGEDEDDSESQAESVASVEELGSATADSNEPLRAEETGSDVAAQQATSNQAQQQESRQQAGVEADEGDTDRHSDPITKPGDNIDRSEPLSKGVVIVEVKKPDKLVAGDSGGDDGGGDRDEGVRVEEGNTTDIVSHSSEINAMAAAEAEAEAMGIGDESAMSLRRDSSYENTWNDDAWEVEEDVRGEALRGLAAGVAAASPRAAERMSETPTYPEAAPRDMRAHPNPESDSPLHYGVVDRRSFGRVTMEAAASSRVDRHIAGRRSYLEGLDDNGEFRPERLHELREILAATGLPIHNVRMLAHKPNEIVTDAQGNETDLGVAASMSVRGEGHGTLTVHDCFDKYDPALKKAVLVHEVMHSLSALDERNNVAFGNRAERLAALDYVKSVVDQSLKTGVPLNEYHEHLLSEYRAQEKLYGDKALNDDEAAIAEMKRARYKLDEESQAILIQMTWLDRDELAAVQERQHKVLENNARMMQSVDPNASENPPKRVNLLTNPGYREQATTGGGADRISIRLLRKIGVETYEDFMAHVEEFKGKDWSSNSPGHAHSH